MNILLARKSSRVWTVPSCGADVSAGQAWAALCRPSTFGGLRVRQRPPVRSQPRGGGVGRLGCLHFQFSSQDRVPQGRSP